MTNPTLSRALLICSALVLLTACGQQAGPGGENGTESQAAPAQESAAAPRLNVDAARIIAADQEPENWLSHGRSYDEQRFSPLNQVNAANVADLGLAWRFDFETKRGLEATPIVVDGMMFTTGAWSRVYALDAKTGKLLWEFDPEVPGEWAVHACCDPLHNYCTRDGAARWRPRGDR